MNPVARPRIKICCIESAVEAQMAIAAGADALGLVSSMPSGPGVISEAEIARITPLIPSPVASVLLTAEVRAEAILRQIGSCGPTAIQLVDRVAPDQRRALRRAAPALRIWQVVHVADASAIEEAHEAAETSDVVLLDSGAPEAEIRELGGTGRVHNWSLSARIVDAVDKPVFLAGGLKPDNVAEAISTVRPFGLDLCTGVRTDGRLDPAKLQSFFKAVA